MKLSVSEKSDNKASLRTKVAAWLSVSTTRAVILFCIGAVMFLCLSSLFYEQAMGTYHSDLRLHIKYATSSKGYSVLYWIMGVLNNCTGGKINIVMLDSILVVATWLLLGELIRLISKGFSFFTSALISFPVTFISGIYIPFVYEKFYSGQLITQPYHNITYYGMRLAAVAAMIFFFKIFEYHIKHIKWQHWLGLSLCLAISTSVKPSFFYGFALALLLFLIADFCNVGFKSKPFLRIIAMGCSVFPSLLIMLWQSQVLYGGASTGASTASGIAIIWGENFFKSGASTVILKLICGVAFPALVAVFNRKRMGMFDVFVYIMFVIQMLIYIMFAETGKRASHGNFLWGVYSAAFFLFVVAVPRFIENLKTKSVTNKFYLIFGSVLLSAHVISAVAYFVEVFSGQIPYRI